jgi:hypothetical protein
VWGKHISFIDALAQVSINADVIVLKEQKVIINVLRRILMYLGKAIFGNN